MPAIVDESTYARVLLDVLARGARARGGPAGQLSRVIGTQHTGGALKLPRTVEPAAFGAARRIEANRRRQAVAGASV
jgi:hypothetical protein